MKKDGRMFVDIVRAEILDRKPDGLEVAGYEDSDIMFIKAVAIEEGLNANDALFLREDLHRAYYSLVGKPLKIRFVGNNPTGHGYNPKTGGFDEIVKAIGVIYRAEPQLVKDDGTVEDIWGDDIPEGGKYQIVVTMGVWQKYYPEIANRLRQLHDDGELKFSIEAEREFEITPEGYRKCFNILFNGLAVVKNPAFENARSLVVAELLREGGNKKMDFEKMYHELLEKYNAQSGELKVAQTAQETAEKALKAEQDKNAELSEQLTEKEGTLKTVLAERDSYKSTVEQAEKQTLGAERLAKLQKYGEVAQTADELAEMSKEQFVDVLAEMVESYSPTGQENAERDVDVQGAYFDHTKRDNTSRRDKLLAFVSGLAK